MSVVHSTTPDMATPCATRTCRYSSSKVLCVSPAHASDRHSVQVNVHHKRKKNRRPYLQHIHAYMHTRIHGTPRNLLVRGEPTARIQTATTPAQYTRRPAPHTTLQDERHRNLHLHAVLKPQIFSPDHRPAEWRHTPAQVLRGSTKYSSAAMPLLANPSANTCTCCPSTAPHTMQQHSSQQ